MAIVIPKDFLKTTLNNLKQPDANSHKGQNGRLLIIGGSHLFHAASLWAAEIACHFVDLVHYSSTQENNQIFINLKTKFTNGIIIQKKDLLSYVEEDDCILLGPGMVRGSITHKRKQEVLAFKEIINLKDDVEYTYFLTKFLLNTYPNKRFVIDAGAMQMMDPVWLTKLLQPAIITPHNREFETLFKISLEKKSLSEKKQIAVNTAQKYNCIILLKSIIDIITDGNKLIIVEGGNAGLTKGGSGDILAGLTASLYSKSDQITSAIIASYIIKSCAEQLSKTSNTWYSTNELIDEIPKILHQIYVDS